MPTPFPYPSFPVRQGPVTPLRDPTQTTDELGANLNRAIPGFSMLNASAVNNVGNLLNGLPSAAPVQRANAYFGIASGVPGSDYIRNRGADIYGQQAEQYRARGFDDFLKLLQTGSGTLTPTAGEQIGEVQGDQNLQQRQIEANQGVAGQNASYAQRGGYVNGTPNNDFGPNRTGASSMWKNWRAFG